MLKSQIQKTMKINGLDMSIELVRSKGEVRVILAGPVSVDFICSVMSDNSTRAIQEPQAIQRAKLIRSVLGDGKVGFIFDSHLGSLMRIGDDCRLNGLIPELQQRVLSRLLELHGEVEEEANILLDAHYSVEIDWAGACKKFRMENEAVPQVSDAYWLENFGPEYAQVIHLNIPQKRGFLSEAV